MIPLGNDPDHDSGVAVQNARPKLKRPRKYAVLLLNDDYTTMEFVLEVLQKYFHLSEPESHQVMMKVHEQGKGTAGIYSLEIAETKVEQVHEAARTQGFPLRCAMEPLASSDE
jgi:ATP-dependent Clp protease adaptor protein ClpS